MTKPKAVLFTVGPRKKYIHSLAAALGCEYKVLEEHIPTKNEPLKEISGIVDFGQTCRMFITYHAMALQLLKRTKEAIDELKDKLKKEP